VHVNYCIKLIIHIHMYTYVIARYIHKAIATDSIMIFWYYYYLYCYGDDLLLLYIFWVGFFGLSTFKHVTYHYFLFFRYHFSYWSQALLWALCNILVGISLFCFFLTYFSHLFFFPAILFFPTYYVQYFAHHQIICSKVVV